MRNISSSLSSNSEIVRTDRSTRLLQRYLKGRLVRERIETLRWSVDTIKASFKTRWLAQAFRTARAAAIKIQAQDRRITPWIEKVQGVLPAKSRNAGAVGDLFPEGAAAAQQSQRIGTMSAIWCGKDGRSLGRKSRGTFRTSALRPAEFSGRCGIRKDSRVCPARQASVTVFDTTTHVLHARLRSPASGTLFPKLIP